MKVNTPQVPVTVTLLVPYHIPRARGVHVAAKYSYKLTIRLNDDEYDSITHAAKLCGVTHAEFVRSFAVKGAQVIIKETEKDERGSTSPRDKYGRVTRN